MSRAAHERPRVVLALALGVLLLLVTGALGATLADSERKIPPGAQVRMQRLEVTVERQQRSIDAARGAAERRDAELGRAQARGDELRQANRTLRRRVERLRRTQRRRQARPARARPSSSAATNLSLAGVPPSAPAAPAPPERPIQNSPTTASAASGGEFAP